MSSGNSRALVFSDSGLFEVHAPYTFVRSYDCSIAEARRRSMNPNFWVRIILWWGGGLPREGVGAKEFGMCLETKGKETFWRDILELPEKFEKKVCVQFLATNCNFRGPYKWCHHNLRNRGT